MIVTKMFSFCFLRSGLRDHIQNIVTGRGKHCGKFTKVLGEKLLSLIFLKIFAISDTKKKLVVTVQHCPKSKVS